MRLFIAVLSLTAFTAVSAQSGAKGAIRVTVTDRTDSALVGAEVRFPTLDVGFTVPRGGVLVIKDVPSGTYVLQARHVGYGLASRIVTVSSDTAKVHFALEGGVTLDTTRVNAVASGWMEEFERHRKLGFGQFFTIEDLAGQQRLSSFLRNARGVRVISGNPDVLASVRSAGRCSALEIYVDGFPMSVPGAAATPMVALQPAAPPRPDGPSNSPPRVTVGANSSGGSGSQQGSGGSGSGSSGGSGSQGSGSQTQTPRTYSTANALANSDVAKGAPTSSINSGPGATAFDINSIPVLQVAAIEVYVDAASIPATYKRPNSECGAIFIWTK